MQLTRREVQLYPRGILYISTTTIPQGYIIHLNHNYTPGVYYTSQPQLYPRGILYISITTIPQGYIIHLNHNYTPGVYYTYQPQLYPRGILYISTSVQNHSPSSSLSQITAHETHRVNVGGYTVQILQLKRGFLALLQNTRYVYYNRC